MYTFYHRHELCFSATAFDDAVEEQEELQPEPYPAIVTLIFWRLKYMVKRLVLRYMLRRNIISDMSWFTKEEKEFTLIRKSKWTLRLLIFFVDHTTGDLDYREQWKCHSRCHSAPKPSSNVTPISSSNVDETPAQQVVHVPARTESESELEQSSPRSGKSNWAVARSLVRLSPKRSASRSRSLSRSASSLRKQKSIGELLANRNDLDNMTRDDFKLILQVARTPEVYPQFNEVLRNNMSTNIGGKRESSAG